ncbi:hypothetical protein D3C87_1773710 [compost metagenome]
MRAMSYWPSATSAQWSCQVLPVSRVSLLLKARHSPTSTLQTSVESKDQPGTMLSWP